MGLTGAPGTYERLKDLVFGPIPEPNAEPAVCTCLGKGDYSEVTFKYFVDDDYGASPTFETLLRFLHHFYFPRLVWARLTLKLSKSKFFVPSIEPLGMLVGLHLDPELHAKYGLRASDAKWGKIEGFPTPTNAQELEAFLYLMTYLKMLIPECVELARIMKTAIIRGIREKVGSNELDKKEGKKKDGKKRGKGVL